MSNIVYVIAGVYLMAMGYTGRTLVNESDVAPEEIERVKRNAGAGKRTIAIGVGLLLLMYGTFQLGRLYHDHR